jgi:transketolase
MDQRTLDERTVNTIRTLAMDAVEQAHSGHPGTPMALAPVVYTLWQRFLRFDPDDPSWENRDRFVLSAGHAAMLLYAMLHLTGVKAIDGDCGRRGMASVTLDDIKRFRKLDSKCPGHPEYRLTSGVEATTGPLGQGAGSSVGMAIAERWLAARYNRPGFPLFDYDVYALCSDGDMMEGVASEAASLAGHLKLSNLCWIYDSNRVTIEGPTSLAFSEDVALRFRAYGWNVARVGNANDLEQISVAIETFRQCDDRPTLIIVESQIGYGAPHKQGSSAAHGTPLGEAEVRLSKRCYGWPEDSEFLVPEEVRQNLDAGFGDRGRRLRAAWQERLAAYAARYPEFSDQIQRIRRRELPRGWDADLPVFPPDTKGLAGRDASSKVLNAIANGYPWLIGGSADLAPSTKTRLEHIEARDFEAGCYAARNFHFGVREHAMGAILNGIALSKVRVYGSTFLVFSDYMKPSMRLAALMELPIIYVFTHDSIGVGEDGPTHQPIEQLIALRSIPGLITLRPADANEVVEAWRVVVGLRRQPACLVLSRQPLPTLDRVRYAPASGVSRGGYILAEAEGSAPEVLLIGTGSEVSLCIDAYEKLKAEGVRARVISLPSWELFEQQDEAYRELVLPSAVTARVSVEQASVLGWDHYVGVHGAKIGMRGFGSSAPYEDLATKFGFTAEKVIGAAKAQIARSKACNK